MTINGYDNQTFGQAIGDIFSPARAVNSIEFLKGREANLQQISRAFTAKGRHVFIYGDRGVGKTSLALTSAYIHQNSGADPIAVSCDSETTLYSLIRDIANQALGMIPGRTEKTSATVDFSFKFLSASKSSEIQSGNVPEITSINECIDIIRYLEEIHSTNPVIVIDEFDRIKEPKIKRQFAEFLKKMSDDDVCAKLIICGIASTLDGLIDEHLSIARNIASIELKRLGHDGRWAIINDAAARFNISLPENMVIRIGQISDGFPHYVHLVGEKLFWALFDDADECLCAKKRHFDKGVADAVSEAEALPRLAYAKATEKYTDDYREVLWAVADGPHLRRQTSEIYYKSYLQIMRERPGREIIDKLKFSNRLNRLKLEPHGYILEATGGGWYQYSDNVVRGYVRLKAQQDGIEIGDGYTKRR